MKISSALPKIKEELPSLFHSSKNANRMINQSNFDSLVNEWITEEETILSFNVSMKSGAVIIVTESKTTNFKSSPMEYSIYRIFPSYEKWNISMDLQSQPLDKMVEHLLYYR